MENYTYFIKRIKVLASILLLLLIFCSCNVYADTLDLPKSLREIEDEAFFGDTSITELILPEGIVSRGERAFAIPAQPQGRVGEETLGRQVPSQPSPTGGDTQGQRQEAFPGHPNRG